ncbi:inositol monophosphatase family protein [Brevibacillus sp. NRS-1366]|uniref:inositol monophosphatase family protein n=1 Tax=Brevibacillus sp. NRS-1366 TaxID=3233899 RepID=UPI003D1A652F
MEDYTKFIAVAEKAADMSRLTLDQHRKNYLYGNFDFETKADASPVTEIDQKVERQLREMIQQHCPDHGILGEEYGAEAIQSEFVWVIDPIDGTRQFITGVPVYGTLIALCHHGVPVLGVIDIPSVAERWIGVKGKQTTLNGRPVSTRVCKQLSEALMSSSNTEPVLSEHRKGYEKLIEATKFRVYGAACYAYACLATGKIDVSVDSGGMREVDYCALVPVIEGAGGVITDWDGKPLTIHSGTTVVAAGDADLHAQALAILQYWHKVENRK